jgi:hypothetical protein
MESPTGTRPTVLPNEQRRMGAPVVNAPGLPAMEKASEVRTVLRDPALPEMPAHPDPKPSEGRFMEEAGPVVAPAPPSSHGLGPQRPLEPRNPPSPSEGYLRLEVHFENGRLSVIGAKEVAGPLMPPSAVIQGHAYEVLIGERQVALGSLPDVGVRRAFANRDVPDPQSKHFFLDVPTFDFFVRVPKALVTADDLPKMNIILHNVRHSPDRLAPALPLRTQPGVEAEEVARLSGVELERAPEAVRSQLERIISENRTAQ